MGRKTFYKHWHITSWKAWGGIIVINIHSYFKGIKGLGQTSSLRILYKQVLSVSNVIDQLRIFTTQKKKKPFLSYQV